MARKPAKEVQEKKRLALQMNASGATDLEISVAVDRNIKTVKTWLRKAQPRRETYRNAVWRELQKGASYSEAAKIAGCSPEHARRIEREERGWLKETHRTPAQAVADFVSDPHSHRSDRFTRSHSFGRELLALVDRELNRNPAKAGELIDLAATQFKSILRSARSPNAVQKATCNLTIAMALYAARERVMEEPQSALNTIRSIDPGSCRSCQAEIARRESLILRDLKEYPWALFRLSASAQIYRAMGHSGHDFGNNGLGACAFAECTTHYYNGSAAVAVAVADRALAELVQPHETALHFGLRFNKALALLDIPGQDAATARDTANSLLAECGAEPSLTRLRAGFLAGRAAELDGDPRSAAAFFYDAYDDAQTLKLPAGVGALLADITRVEPPSPGNFREQIRRLRDQQIKWILPIASALVSAYRQSETNLEAAIAQLRRSSGGNKLLPHSATQAV